MRLTVAVLVKGELARLDEALPRLRELADELLVVGASEAQILGVPPTAGVRVLTSEGGDARRTALRHCRTEWLLLLDEDESIDPLDQAVIREALHLTEVGGFRLLRRSYLRSGASLCLRAPIRIQGGPSAAGGPFSHCTEALSLRLLRRVEELPEEGAAPETWMARRGQRTIDLDAVVHHVGDFREDRGIRLRLERIIERRRRHPEDPAHLEALLETALQAGAWETALEAAAAHERRVAPSPFDIRFGAGLALLGLGRHEEALARFDALRAEAPDHAPLLAARAEALWRAGSVHEAQEAFDAALEADPGLTLSYLRLADLFEAHGLWEDARLVLEAGLDQNPQDLQLWEALVDRAAARKDPRAARDAWNGLQRVPDGGRGQWHQLLIHTLIAKDRRREALDILRKGLQAFPDHDELLALKQRMGA